MKGGYKIIDFKSIPLSDSDHPVLVPGLRAVLDNNYNKAVLLTNVVLGSTIMDDCFSTVILKDNGRIKLNSYDGYITVDSNSYAHYTEGGSGDPTAEIEEIKEDISDIQTDIGDLSELETTAKTDLVSAVNEVKGGVGNNATAITATQQIFAPVLTSLVAPTGGLSTGDQFIYNGLLYKATVDISEGGTIVINGNAELADCVTEQIGTSNSIINSVIARLPHLYEKTLSLQAHTQFKITRTTQHQILIIIPSAQSNKMGFIVAANAGVLNLGEYGSASWGNNDTELTVTLAAYRRVLVISDEEINETLL